MVRARTLIGIVPFRYAGAFRRVYPGFLQIAAFMSMNFDRHLQQLPATCYEHLVKGETDKAETIETFYEEYFAVMDLPAEFYLETVQRDLPGPRSCRAAISPTAAGTVDPGAIRAPRS